MKALREREATKVATLARKLSDVKTELEAVEFSIEFFLTGDKAMVSDGYFNLLNFTQWYAFFTILLFIIYSHSLGRVSRT